jgi:uncharacterized membrane protein YbhN (UPF0104 family)
VKEHPPPIQLAQDGVASVKGARRRWPLRVVRVTVGLGFLIAAAVVVSGRRRELLGTTALLGHVHPWWLALAVVAEIVSVVALADAQRILLVAGDAPMGLGSLTAITLGANALGTTLPGGQAWATVFTYRQYLSRGATRGVAAWALVAAAALSSAALAVVAAGGAIAASDNGPSPTWGLWLLVGLAAAASLGMVAALRRPRPVVRILVRAIDSAGRLIRRPTGRITGVIERATDQMLHVRPRRRVWGTAFVLAMVNWLADCACLCMGFLAVGVPVPWRGLLLAYAAGQLVTIAALTPGGIGVVEGSLAVTLVAYGAGDVSTIAAVLIYRIISYWALLAMGWPIWAFLHYRREE